MKPCVLLVALCGLLASSAYAAGAQPVAVFTFTCNGSQIQRTGPCPDGGRGGALIQGSDGNFYGTAQDSMEGSSTPSGGTVYSLSSSGTFKLLHTFSAGTNKTYPNGNLPGFLMQGPDGKIYGTTLFGGISGCNGYCGDGVLYRVNTDGSGFQILHKFCSQTNCADGSTVVSRLVTGTDGNLYGTTNYGGTGSCFPGGCGTLYKVIPSSGAFKVVFDFDFSTTGEAPSALVMVADGTFYGLSMGSLGPMLFHFVESTGSVTAISLNFPVVNGLPENGSLLTLGPNGNFYGLYFIYGVSGAGLFEVQPDGSNLQMFPFYTTTTGSGAPEGLLLASDGNFWIPNLNGSSGYGNIQTVSATDGSLIQTLSPFSATAAIGAFPTGLLQAPNGILWGTTDSYGKATKNHFGDGTVFSLNAGLPPR